MRARSETRIETANGNPSNYPIMTTNGLFRKGLSTLTRFPVPVRSVHSVPSRRIHAGPSNHCNISERYKRA